MLQSRILLLFLLSIITLRLIVSVVLLTTSFCSTSCRRWWTWDLDTRNVSLQLSQMYKEENKLYHVLWSITANHPAGRHLLPPDSATIALLVLFPMYILIWCLHSKEAKKTFVLLPPPLSLPILINYVLTKNTISCQQQQERQVVNIQIHVAFHTHKIHTHINVYVCMYVCMNGCTICTSIYV